MEELRRRLDVLAQEIERLRSGEEEAELTEAERRTLAVAPSAAAVYRKRQGVSFAGYGEMLYERYDQSIESGARDPRAARLDFLRLILYSGYRFNERFLLNSEIELEHSNEASVEFAYVDFRLNDFATLRGGLVLLPMGLVNEFHEPTVFIGSRRPETETRILPSTWRENGFGLLGARGPVSYRAYVVNGLDAAGFNSDGLRGGRQKGARAQAADMAIVARADVTPTAGVFVGGSIYSGQSDQDQFMADGSPIDVATTIGEVHGQAQLRGLDVRALYARASLGGVAGLNAALGLTGDTGVGSAMSGGYTQVGYNVLNRRGTAVELTPFYRFERVNTHAEVPEGFLIDPSRKIEFQTLGLELRPVTGVVVKADYQWISNDARTGRNQFNVVLGYAF
ncbi:MAG TPA: hypothetical protein VK886_13330 [Vicinamibacterales bacterium]|nr:hypothetical protein [Vicinamibacterales bacterium]